MACEQKMGFYRPEWGGTGTTGTLKRKFRWLFNIENVTVDNNQALPCFKAARPKFTFKEMQAEHLNETISFPSKPDWTPINISLYDRCINSQNPIFSWLKRQYDPSPAKCSAWFPCIDPVSFKVCCSLQLLDGCGNTIEAWVLEHCYPQNIDWGELDMASSDIVTVDFTLRYDRAFQIFPVENHALPVVTTCVISCIDPPSCIPTGGGISVSTISSIGLNYSGFAQGVMYSSQAFDSPDFIMT